MCMICDGLHATPDSGRGISRRTLLTAGAAAAAALGGVSALAQAPGGAPRRMTLPQPPRNALALSWDFGRPYDRAAAERYEAERQTSSRTAGMKFRGHVRYGNAMTLETMTLKPMHPVQVVIRAQAAQVCYSQSWQLDTTTTQNNATITGHGGVGTVIDVGRDVKRVKVGDQVIISATPNCGVCGNCAAGRGDTCSTRLPAIAAATMADNTPVFQGTPPVGPGGHAEILVSDEAWVVPVFTSLSPVELSQLACPAAVGFGMAIGRFPVQPGTNVAVWGLGPMGLGAVQGARLQGANAVIGIDPIRYRRELAMKLGATVVLDPNEYKGNDIVAKIQSLTPDVVPTDRRYAGELEPGVQSSIECTAPTTYPLAAGIEAPPADADLWQQIFMSTRSAGSIVMAGQARVSAGSMFGGKVILGGNFPGINVLHDLPRYVRLAERGHFDLKSIVGKTYSVDRSTEAMMAAGDRSTITAVVGFS